MVHSEIQSNLGKLAQNHVFDSVMTLAVPRWRHDCTDFEFAQSAQSSMCETVFAKTADNQAAYGTLRVFFLSCPVGLSLHHPLSLVRSLALHLLVRLPRSLSLLSLACPSSPLW